MPVCVTDKCPRLDASPARMICGTNGERIKLTAGGSRPGAGRPHNAPGHVSPPRRAPRPYDAPLVGSDDPGWFVVNSHPHGEYSAVCNIARMGYHGYLPQVAMRKRDRHGLYRKVMRPMFSGYLFVFLYPADQWVPIKHAGGVRDLLRTVTGTPMPVRPLRLVDALIEGDVERLDLDPEIMPRLPVGGVIRVEQGALEGLTGTVTECDGQHTMVIMALFGRTVPVKLQTAWLSLIL